MAKQTFMANIMYNKTAIIKNVVAVLLMLAILVFEGCFNFATLSWEWERLISPAFWVKIGIRVCLLIALRVIMLLIFLDIARATNKDLVIQKKNNEKLMKLKGRDFPAYIENVKNPEIKIEAYKLKTNKQLIKLEKKAKAEDRALYFSDDELKESLKEKNEYCIKRKELELKLTDEYINKNYHWLDVKHYEHIDPAVFDMPISNEKENKYQLTSKTKTALIVGLSTACLGLLVTQTVWTASDIAKIEDYNALAVFIGMLMDLIFMLWQGIQGIFQAFRIVSTQEVLPYTNRNRILKDYIFWKEPNKVDNLVKWIDMMEEETKQELLHNKEDEGA